MRGRDGGGPLLADGAVDRLGEAAAHRDGRLRVAQRLALVVTAGALLAVAGWLLDGGRPPVDLTLAAAVLATGSGAAAALLAVFAVRHVDEPRVAWVAMALGCYSVLVVPSSAIATLDAAPAAEAVRLVADAVVAGLLLAAAVAASPVFRRRVRLVLSGTAAAVTGAALLGVMLPRAVEAVVSLEPLPLGLALAWTAAGVTIAVRATDGGAHGLGQVGAGIALIGAARVLLLAGSDRPLVDVAAVSISLRLVAVALVVYGALRLARQALARLEDRHHSLEEELRVARARLARTAERDHELRNGLAGLAGATSLLGGGCPDPSALGTVVASELGRLDDLLQTPLGAARAVRPATYAVAPLLDGLAMLRRSAGIEVDQELEPGLRAVGSSDRLAQVVINLFANVERHAPGSAVRITAKRRGDRAVVLLRDFGPGVAQGREEAVFQRGMCDPDRGGLGLGLLVCRRLLAAEGGTITVRPPDPDDPGCVVVVDLPAAPAAVVVPRPARPSRSPSVAR